ncbi:MAG: FAD-dependent oxidoreductase, partial [Janthinobacterium sp.]
MKKLLTLALCLALLVFALPAMAAPTDGAYTASADGNNGPVEVTVTFAGNKIQDIAITQHAETPGICEAALERIPAAIIETQSLAVDMVSGATNTSKAIVAAVEDCIAQAGGDVAAMKAVAGAPQAAVTADETLTYDVIVVGGGAAGIGAAANAADAGASVVLFEKLAHTGGNTLISGGLIYATGTTFQKDAGVEDSVEALVDYWNDRAEGHADKALLTLVAEKSADTIAWLMENGVKLTGPTTAGTSPVPRMQSTGEGGGGFILPMTEAIEKRGVEIRLETPVKALLTDETGAVIGVEAVAADGHKITAYANGGVVLASGGFDRSEEMKRKYAPSYADEVSFSSIGNEGDGIKMAMAIGADTVFHDGAIGLRGVLPTSFADPNNGFVWAPNLLVDASGARILNETLDYPIY